MPENPLEVRLEATDQRPGHFTLTFNSSHYPVILNPEANVTFSDWLRRLRPVLAGQSDPSGRTHSGSALTQRRNVALASTASRIALLPSNVTHSPKPSVQDALPCC